VRGRRNISTKSVQVMDLRGICDVLKSMRVIDCVLDPPEIE
jgi:hypothetical protein